jgi:phage-related protein
MKNLLILATMLLTISFVNAQSSSPFDGVWVGQGLQLNNNQTWTIKLTVLGDNIIIDYPSLGCSAKLTKSKSEQNKLYLSEKMINANTCVDNGKIELEWLAPNEIRFKWSFSNGTPGSVATLHKF